MSRPLLVVGLGERHSQAEVAWLHERIEEQHPELDVLVISGVTSLAVVDVDVDEDRPVVDLHLPEEG